MPWSPKARNQAIILIAVVVPGLMFGLGVGSYLIARAAGIQGAALWVIALVMATVGLVLSMVITLRVGKSYESLPKQKKSDRTVSP